MADVNYAGDIAARVTAEITAVDPACTDPELLRLYALLALVKGTDTTLQDVHDAWALRKDATRPDHRSLVPFDELTVEVQELDRIYQEAIHKVAGGAR